MDTLRAFTSRVTPVRVALAFPLAFIAIVLYMSWHDVYDVLVRFCGWVCELVWRYSIDVFRRAFWWAIDTFEAWLLRPAFLLFLRPTHVDIDFCCRLWYIGVTLLVLTLPFVWLPRGVFINPRTGRTRGWLWSGALFSVGIVSLAVSWSLRSMDYPNSSTMMWFTAMAEFTAAALFAHWRRITDDIDDLTGVAASDNAAPGGGVARGRSPVRK